MTQATVDTGDVALLRKQAWLSNAPWDLFWIIGPAVLSTTLIWLFRGEMQAASELPIWAWVLFVLLVDVAHVYSTLFRTYLNPKVFEQNRVLLLTIPAACWVVGSLLYSLDAIFFWRSLAYIAVFHFIRQQYGFVILYSRRESQRAREFRWLDCAAIYAATIYPMLFWHTHMPRNFSWFVAGDFIETLPDSIYMVSSFIYCAIFATYVAKELFFAFTEKVVNVPKNLLILATAFSWWTGIIAFNSDLAFTITNVVSHGVPYMALIWLYHHQDGSTEKKKATVFQKTLLSNFALFFAFLAFLAYVEEGFWDGLIWREHLSVFMPFANLPVISDAALLAILVPFLALPQSTHYVLDGFIWRVKDQNSLWRA